MSRRPPQREAANYLHCKKCMTELPRGKSPALWARLSVGVIPGGVQVWCERHDAEVIRIDFAQLEAWKADVFDEECELCRELAAEEPHN